MSRQPIFVTVPLSWEQNILHEIFAFSFLKATYSFRNIGALPLERKIYFEKFLFSLQKAKYSFWNVCVFPCRRQNILFEIFSFCLWKAKYSFLKYPRSPRQQGLPTACATSKGDGSWGRGGQGGQSQGADSALHDDADLWKSTFIFSGNCSWWWAKGSTSSEG